MEKRIVVTGASGHIGFHIASQLLYSGYAVTLLIRRENINIAKLKALGATTHQTDFNDPSSYRNILTEAEVLFHAASENTTDTSDEKRVLTNTYQLTKSVINAAIKSGVKTIIYTSSVVVLGRSSSPDVLINEKQKTTTLESPYVKGKFLAEQYIDKIIAEKNIDIRRLYPSWVIGSDNAKLTPPHKIIKNFLLGGQVFYFKGGISVASVESVAQAHINAWLKGKLNEKYIVAGTNISFKKFYTVLAKLTKRKAPFIFLPKTVILAGAVVGKFFLGKKSPVDPAYVKKIVGNFSWYNSDKAIKELGYTIPGIDEMISGALIDVQQKIVGLDKIFDRKNTSLNRIQYNEKDVLLITGFPGWLGIRMVDILINADKLGENAVSRKIKLLVQPKYKSLIVNLPSNITVSWGDITNKEDLKYALQNVKCVYHLAGAVYPKKVKTYYKVNYEGTKNLVDACVECKVRRILFMSTDSICGFGSGTRIFDDKTKAHPYKYYGRSKYLAEKYILDKTAEGLIDGTSLRGFWFFGPNSPSRNLKFFKMFHWKRQIVFGDGENFRSISHLDNIVQAFIKAEPCTQTIGKWYWIANKPVNLTVDEIYKNIADAFGTTYKPFYIPKSICELINILDSVISLTGRINPTLSAAGKFHKDIAGEIIAAEQDFNFEPQVTFNQIKEEIQEDLLMLQ